MAKSVVVVGVGASDGVGGALARRFAREGLHAIIAGRTPEKIEAVADEVKRAGGSAEAFRADVTSALDQNAIFELVASRGEVAAVLYNAGNNAIIPFEKLDAETYEAFWRVGNYGAFLTAKWAIPILKNQGEGSLFFTGASGSLRGKPNFAHFASMKAGLRALAQSLSREFGKDGVHVAHFVIDGVINGEMANSRFSEYVQGLGEDGSLSPDAIADTFWHVHSQHRSAWTHELDVRPFRENW